MHAINIRPVNTADIIELQKISKQTFLETFAVDNTKENIEDYVAQSFSIESLTHEVKNKDSEFYFAEQNGKIIGYLKLNSGQSQTELQDERGLEIERIYVCKEFHGKKVGQILYEKALEIAVEKKMHFVWLGVWEENPRAINFYRKNGFVEFGKHTFKLGEDEQIDIMMKLQLK